MDAFQRMVKASAIWLNSKSCHVRRAHLFLCLPSFSSVSLLIHSEYFAVGALFRLTSLLCPLPD